MRQIYGQTDGLMDKHKTEKQKVLIWNGFDAWTDKN